MEYQTGRGHEMPEPFVIPKQGVLQYVYILLPMKFTEDTGAGR
jgi:hypothetical protein